LLSKRFNLSVVPSKPRFSGRFFTHAVRINADHEKGEEEVLIVYSKGSRLALVKYLWLKFLWDQLTKEEFLLFISMNETLQNEKKFNYLKIINEIPKKEARKRLLNLETRLGEEVSKRESYQGIKYLGIEIYIQIRRLPKPTKFSGYVKTPSAVGTKSRGGSSFLETTTDQNEILKSLIEPINWYRLLAIGPDNLLFEDLIFPDEF
jgi:hypothetical protein